MNGWHYDSLQWRGHEKSFWVIGLLPSGDVAILRQKSDGTYFHDTLIAASIPYLRAIEQGGK